MRSRPFRRTSFAVAFALAVATLILPSPTLAARPPYPPGLDVRSPQGNVTHVLRTPAYVKHARSDNAGGVFNSTTPLVQGSGPIMKDPTNYLIFWKPAGTTFATGYEQEIQRFFQDVSGSPFLNIETQYGGTNGGPTNTSHFGGLWEDTNAYPAPDDGTTANPLSDADIQQAVNDAIAANPSWAPTGDGTSQMYFVFTGYFTADNTPVHSCMSSSECFAALDANGPTGSAYCAYHGVFGSPDHVYASQPYDSKGSCYPTSYNGGPYPNAASDADITLSAVSHEMFEANTDPELSNWRDSSGDEIGDKCAYVYPWGDPSAGPFERDGTDFVLGGHPYFLQTEWSNAPVSWNTTQPPGQNPSAPGCVKRDGQDSQAVIATPSLDFGNLGWGDSKTLAFFVANSGLADMNILDIRMAPGSDPAFALTAPTHATVRPGQQQVASITFTAPSFDGSNYAGSVIVDFDDPQPVASLTVSLHATVGHAIATLNTSSVAFGGVATDDRTSPHAATSSVILSNTGGADLTLSGLSTGSADFSATSPVSLPATIAPGSSITLSVGFDPTAPGSRAGTLSVVTDAGTKTAALSGTGLLPALGFSPSALVFPPTVLTTQVPGYAGNTLNLGVTNTGQSELIVDAQSASGAPFSVPAAASPPSRYGPNTGFGLPTTFAPTAAGRFTGTVSVSDAGGGEGPVSGSVPACGEGVGRGIRVLVVNGSGTPYSMVTRLKLTSHNTSVPINLNLSNLALVPVATSCVAGQQEQYENQALPSAPGGSGAKGSYYTLAISVGGKSSTLNFSLQATEFKEIVVTVK